MSRDHEPADVRALLGVADFNSIGADRLPGYLGIEIVDAAERRVVAELEVAPHHLAPNGFLHGATVVALADTACGYGCVRTLPPKATGFTTVELKTNFLGTATEGRIRCEATLAHAGRSTQIWDAVVANPAGRTLALFRCTQMVLWPR